MLTTSDSTMTDLEQAITTLVLEPIRKQLQVEPLVLRQGEHRIGSGDDANYRLRIPGIAPLHAKIVVDESSVVIESFDHRTWHDGGPIPRPSKLRVGNELIIGPVSYRVVKATEDDLATPAADVPTSSNVVDEPVALEEAEQSNTVREPFIASAPAATDSNLDSSDSDTTNDELDQLAELHHEVEDLKEELVDQNAFVSPAVETEQQPTDSATNSLPQQTDNTPRLEQAERKEELLNELLEIVQNESERVRYWQVEQEEKQTAERDELLAERNRLEVEKSELISNKNELSDLQQRLHANQESLRTLQEEFDRKNAELNALHADTNSQSKEFESQQVQLDSQKADLAQREAELAERQEGHEQKAAAISTQLEQLQAQEKELEIEKAQFASAQENWQSEQQQAKEELAQQSAEIETQRQQLGELESELEQRENSFDARDEELSQRKTALASQLTSLANLEANVAEREKEFSSQAAAFDQQADAQAVLAEQQNEIEQQLAEVELRKEELEADAQQKEDELAHQREELAAEQSSFAEKQQAFESSRDELAEQRDNLASQQQQLEDERQEIEQQKQELETSLADFEKQQTEAEQQKSELTEEREQLATQQQELDAEHEKLVEERAKLEQEHQELEEKRTELDESLAESKEQDEIEAARENLEKEREEFVAQQQQLEDERQELSEQKQELENSLADITKQQTDTEQQASELTEEREQLAAQQQQLDEERAKLEQEQQGLEEERQELNESLADSKEQDEIESAQVKLEEEREQLATEQQKLEDERAKLEQEKQELEESQSSLKEQQDEITDDQEKLQIARDVLIAERAELEERERNLNAIEEKGGEPQTELIDESEQLETSGSEPATTEIGDELTDSADCDLDDSESTEINDIEEPVAELDAEDNNEIQQELTADDGDLTDELAEKESSETESESADSHTPSRLDNLFDNLSLESLSSPDSEVDNHDSAEEQIGDTEPLEASSNDTEEGSGEATELRSALADMFGLSADELTESEASTPADDEPNELEDQEENRSHESAFNSDLSESETDAELESQHANEEVLAEEPLAEEVSLNDPAISDDTTPATEEPESSSSAEIAIDDIEDPDSVQAYMQRLLERNRKGAEEGEKPVAHEAKEDEPVVEEPEEPKVLMPEVSKEEATVIYSDRGATEDAEPLEPKHRQDKDQMRAKIDSLREVANLSARTAIAKYGWEQMRGTILLQAGLAILSFGIAGMIFVVCITQNQPVGSMAWAAAIAGCVMSYNLWKTWKKTTEPQVVECLAEDLKEEGSTESVEEHSTGELSDSGASPTVEQLLADPESAISTINSPDLEEEPAIRETEEFVENVDIDTVEAQAPSVEGVVEEVNAQDMPGDAEESAQTMYDEEDIDEDIVFEVVE